MLFKHHILDLPSTVAGAQETIRLAHAAQEAANEALEIEAAAYLEWGRALSRIKADLKAGREQLERTVTLARAAGARQVEADSLRNLCRGCFFERDLVAVATYSKQALAIHRKIGDREGEASALNILGIVSMNRFDYAAARTYYQRSLHIFREIGDRFSEGMVLGNLGGLSSAEGAYNQARAFRKQSLAMHAEGGWRPRVRGQPAEGSW